MRTGFCLSFVISLVTFYLLGTGLGGGQRKACNVPPPRGQRRGNGQNVRRHSLDRLHASMLKQKNKRSALLLLGHWKLTQGGRRPREHVFKNCPHWKAQQKILWAKARNGTERGKDRF